MPGHPRLPHPEPPICGEGGYGFTGKVIDICYDRFGDFEGFALLTEDGRKHWFRGREPEMEELVLRAWTEPYMITVFIERHHAERPSSIVLRRPR